MLRSVRATAGAGRNVLAPRIAPRLLCTCKYSSVSSLSASAVPQRPHHAQPQTRNLAACPPNRSITYSSSETSTPHPSEWPPAREPRATPLARFKSLLTSIGALRRSDRSRTSASTSPRIGCRLHRQGLWYSEGSSRHRKYAIWTWYANHRPPLPPSRLQLGPIREYGHLPL